MGVARCSKGDWLNDDDFETHVKMSRECVNGGRLGKEGSERTSACSS